MSATDHEFIAHQLELAMCASQTFEVDDVISLLVNDPASVREWVDVAEAIARHPDLLLAVNRRAKRHGGEHADTDPDAEKCHVCGGLGQVNDGDDGMGPAVCAEHWTAEYVSPVPIEPAEVESSAPEPSRCMLRRPGRARCSFAKCTVCFAADTARRTPEPAEHAETELSKDERAEALSDLLGVAVAVTRAIPRTPESAQPLPERWSERTGMREADAWSGIRPAEPVQVSTSDPRVFVPGEGWMLLSRAVQLHAEPAATRDENEPPPCSIVTTNGTHYVRVDGPSYRAMLPDGRVVFVGQPDDLKRSQGVHREALTEEPLPHVSLEVINETDRSVDITGSIVSVSRDEDGVDQIQLLVVVRPPRPGTPLADNLRRAIIEARTVIDQSTAHEDPMVEVVDILDRALIADPKIVLRPDHDPPGFSVYENDTGWCYEADYIAGKNYTTEDEARAVAWDQYDEIHGYTRRPDGSVDLIGDVAAMHRILDNGKGINPKTLLLRCQLCEEETRELAEALGFYAPPWEDAAQRAVNQGVRVLRVEPDRAQIAKESFDVATVAIGNLVQFFGEAAARRVWEVAHRSNMAKFPGGVVIKRADGKGLKPDGWTPPDIAGALRLEDE